MKRLDVGNFPGITLLWLDCHRDERGLFLELWREDELLRAGITTRFVQDNYVVSPACGTLRGMHFQVGRAAQAKLITCLRGSLLDVVVDLRRGAPSFGRPFSVRLVDPARSTGDATSIYIPVGFAHGYCTLESETEVLYKVSAHYAPEAERGFVWNDLEVGIDWPFPVGAVRLSERDARLPRFSELIDCFAWESESPQGDRPPERR